MNNDLISREALKFELRQHLAYHKEKAKLTTINADKMSHSLVATGIQLAIDSIDNAPTVERQTGEWIVTQEGRWLYPVCSLCGGKQDVKSNYCPDCGAKMRGEEE